jgi:hypothetical protein
MSEVKELVQRQPWRIGQGQAKNALDPMWVGHEPALCTGEIVWETGSKWWWCKECGYCSCLPTTAHPVPEHPKDYYKKSLDHFYKTRLQQGLTVEEAELQAYHLTGIALRVAASLSPEELGRFVDTNINPE